MLALRIVRSLTALVLAAWLAGCSNSMDSWPETPELNPSSHGYVFSAPPTATAPTVAPTTHYVRRHTERRHHRRTEAISRDTPDQPESTSEEAPDTAIAPAAPDAISPPAGSPSGSAKEAPVVSLGDPYQSQRRAHRLLELTESRLARIDRTKLTEQSAAAYDQASSFVDAAHEALDKRDYSAASSLAEKASLLTNKLISE